MELFRSNLYVYNESPPACNGKWIIADVILNTNGNLNVKIQNEDPYIFQLSSNCVIQAPMDTVWSRIPPLPFRRSAKETFSVHIKKNSTTWFLSSSEEERDTWCKALTSFANRKPPPYGDYDNWNYSHLESEIEPKPSKPFHPRKSLTPQHRTGFYSIQEPRRNSSKFPDTSGTEHHSGIYSPHEPRRNFKFPDSIALQHGSGFYSLHKPKKKTSDEPTVSLVLPQENVQSKAEPTTDNVRCRWCCVACGCLCNVFSSCFQNCCMNFAAAL